MKIKIGDRVRLFDDALHQKYDVWVQQSGGGDGTVKDDKHLPEWVTIEWDNGYVNGYPIRALEVLGDGTMPDPEFDLEEINQGSELYRKLEGR